MTLTSVGLILISAAIHVGWNLTTKSSSNPKVFSALKGLVVLLAGIITFSLLGIGMIPSNILLIGLVSGVIHGIYVYSLSSAYEEGDLSLVYPVVRSSPAFVPVAAWLFLGESISLRGVLGIAIVVACIFALQWRQLSSMSVAGLRSLATNRATLWSFVTLGHGCCLQPGGQGRHDPIEGVGSLAPPTPRRRVLPADGLDQQFNNLDHPGRDRDSRGSRRSLRNEWKIILIAAAGMAMSYSLILHVMQTEKISYIVTLRQSSILMATLIGWLVLKERHGPFRVLVSIIMILGFVLVVFAE